VLQFASTTVVESTDKDAAHPFTNIQGQNNLMENENKEPNKPPTNDNSNAKSDEYNNEIDASTENLAPLMEAQLNPKTANRDNIPNNLVINESLMHGKNQFNTAIARTSYNVELSAPRIVNNLPAGYTIENDLYNATKSPTLAQNVNIHIDNNLGSVYKNCLQMSKTAIVHTPQLKANAVTNFETYHSVQDSMPTGKLHISRFIDNSIKPNNKSK
jgi:hypothetical protein